MIKHIRTSTAQESDCKRWRTSIAGIAGALILMAGLPASASEKAIVVYSAESDFNDNIVLIGRENKAVAVSLARDIAGRISRLPGFKGELGNAEQGSNMGPGRAAFHLGANEYLIVETTNQNGSEIATVSSFSSSSDRPFGEIKQIVLNNSQLPRDFDAASLFPGNGLAMPRGEKPVGFSVADACTIARDSFPLLATTLSNAAQYGADAGMNAQHLSFFSGHRMQIVESDYKQTGKQLTIGFDLLTDLRVKIDSVPAGPERDAITAYGTALEQGFQNVRAYAKLAVFYERSVNSHNIASAAAFSSQISAYQHPRYLNTVTAIQDEADARISSMNASQAHQYLEDNEDNIHQVARSLKLPQLHFTETCH